MGTAPGEQNRNSVPRVAIKIYTCGKKGVSCESSTSAAALDRGLSYSPAPAFISFQSGISLVLRDILPHLDFRLLMENCFLIPCICKMFCVGGFVCVCLCACVGWRGKSWSVVSGSVGQVLNSYLVKIGLSGFYC